MNKSNCLNWFVLKNVYFCKCISLTKTPNGQVGECNFIDKRLLTFFLDT